MRPIVDVVVTHFGDYRYLVQAIKSITASRDVECRILVFDDNPQERIDQNLYFHGRNVEYVKTGHLGLEGVIALSKEYIRSDFVALCASDDLMNKTRLTKQVALVKGEISVVACRQRKFRFHPRLIRIPALSGEIKANHFHELMLLFGPYFADGTLLMTRDFYLNKYSIAIDDSYSDWTSAIRNHSKNNLAIVNEELQYYRQHRSQTTRKTRHQEWTHSSAQLALIELARNNKIEEYSQFCLNIVSAPWCRDSVTNEQLIYAARAMKNIFRRINEDLGSTNSREITNLQRLILRRILLRVKLSNLKVIFSCIRILNFRKVWGMTTLLIFKMLFQFLSFAVSKPRIVKSDNI